jgi:arylformamidase
VTTHPHIVDLSLPLSEDIPRWKVQFESQYLGHGHKSSTITLPVHTATHLDSPSHFIRDGVGIDAFPLDLAVSEAMVIDLTRIEANQCITVDDLAAALPAEYPATILLRTDWPRRAWRTPGFWRDAPYLSEESAVWLAQKKIKMIGYDFPQEIAIKQSLLGPVPEERFVVHLAILSRGIWQIEYLTNLDQLPRRVRLYVFPLKLMGIEASPVRVAAEGL